MKQKTVRMAEFWEFYYSTANEYEVVIETKFCKYPRRSTYYKNMMKQFYGPANEKNQWTEIGYKIKEKVD